MNKYDGYIEDYLFYHFKNMKSDLVERNFELENEIIRINKVEYFLQQSILNKDNYFLKNSGILRNKTQYQIRINNRASFLPVKYIDVLGKETVASNNFIFKNISDNDDRLLKEFKKYTMSNAPMLELYMLVNDISIEKAQSDIEPLMKTKEMKVYLDGSIRFEPVMGYSDIYPYKESIVSIWVYYNFLTDKKIILPLFINQKPRGLYNIPIEDLTRLLFNSQYLKRNPNAIILLTDSIELAGINQKNTDMYNVSDIIWISWYGEGEFISTIDWSLLRGRRVYYLLKEHSGFESIDVYETSRIVKRQLDKLELKEFKYVSLLYKDPPYNRDPATHIKSCPVIYTAAEFEIYMNSRNQFAPCNFIDYKNDLSNLKPKRSILISPLIYQRSTTLIYCDDESDVHTWFALNIAYAKCTGKTAFTGWCSNRIRANVVYLYGESEGYCSLEEKLTTVTNIYGLSNTDPWESRRYFEYLLFDKNKYTYETYDLAILEFIKNIYNNKYQDDNKILIIDNLFSFTAKSLTIQNIILKEFKTAGWAVIVVSPQKVQAKKLGFGNNNTRTINIEKTHCKKIHYDNIIMISEEPSEAGKIKMKVKIKKGYKFPLKEKKEFSCELTINTIPPTFVRKKEPTAWNPKLKSDRNKLNEKVRSLYFERLKGQQIADKLGISLSMVKQIKAKLGLSKRRTPKLVNWDNQTRMIGGT